MDLRGTRYTMPPVRFYRAIKERQKGAMMQQNDSYVVDALACSLPLVKLASLMKASQPWSLVEFSTDNPCFEGDVRSWCSVTGTMLLNFRREGGRTTVVLMRR